MALAKPSMVSEEPSAAEKPQAPEASLDAVFIFFYCLNG